MELPLASFAARLNRHCHRTAMVLHLRIVPSFWVQMRASGLSDLLVVRKAGSRGRRYETLGRGRDRELRVLERL